MRFLVLLAGLAALAAPAWAETLPFPKASYSADATFESRGHQTLAHLNIDHDKERRVVKLTDTAESVVIIRRDKGKLYRLSPSGRAAVEMRTSTAAASGETGPPGANVDALYGIDAVAQGKKTIAGQPTTKFHIKSGDGSAMVDADVWSTDDGIVMRIVGKNPFDSEEPPGKIELSNVTRGPQDATLFEVPKGTEVFSAGGDPVAPESDSAAPAATPAPDAAKSTPDPAR